MDGEVWWKTDLKRLAEIYDAFRFLEAYGPLKGVTLDIVDQRVGDLVGDFVRMSFRNGLGRKEVRH